MSFSWLTLLKNRLQEACSRSPGQGLYYPSLVLLENRDKNLEETKPGENFQTVHWGLTQNS